MRICSLLAIFGVLGVLVVGCGGSSSTSPGGSPSRAAKTNVARVYSNSVTGLAASGMGNANVGAANNTLAVYGGAAVSGSTGGGNTGTGNTANNSTGRVPFFGALLRFGGGLNGGANGPAAANASRHRKVKSRDSSLYYDDWLGLYVSTTSTDTSETTLLYLDAAGSQSAGSITSTYPLDWSVYPNSTTSNYSITAGTFSGAKGAYESVNISETDGYMDYSSTWPGGWQVSGKSQWSVDSNSWSDSATDPDGSWYKTSGTFNADGTGTSQYSDSLGYAATYKYNADGSGSALISGPDQGLPATISWDADGNTTIKYADGTVETYPGYGASGNGTANNGTVTNGTVTGASSKSK